MICWCSVGPAHDPMWLATERRPRGGAKRGRNEPTTPGQSLHRATHGDLCPPFCTGHELAPQIRPVEVDDLVAAAAEHRLDHEDAEAGHLLDADRRRHGELPPVHGD